MTAQEIFNEKGFRTSDNRSIEWRNINKAINFGIGIYPVKSGHYRTTKKGLDYRLKLTFGNTCTYYQAKGLIHFSTSDIVSSCVINCIISFKDMLVEKGIFNKVVELAKSKEMPICTKCKGKGIIPSFLHYCKGVCFDCMGLGYGEQGKIKRGAASYTANII